MASGEIWPIHGPLVPPENLPSVISATDSLSPIPAMVAVGESISLIPGPPLGPSYLMTTTSPGDIVPSRIAFMPASSESNTLAVPSKRIIFLLTADCFTTAPWGARLPLSMAIPPSLWCAFSRGLITSPSEISAESAILWVLMPLTVGVLCIRSFSLLSTAGMPPA